MEELKPEENTELTQPKEVQSEEKPEDYMTIIQEMMAAAPPDKEIFELQDLLQLKTFIERINNIVVKIPAFINSIGKYEEFLKHFDHLTPENRVMASWSHFLERSAASSGEIHIRGAVIFCVPVVHLFITEYEKSLSNS